MGRFLLNGLPISLIYRHLKAKSGALCCSTIPFTPQILHRTSPESLLARGTPRPASRLTFRNVFFFISRDFYVFYDRRDFSMANGVTGIPSMHYYWCANASRYVHCHPLSSIEQLSACDIPTITRTPNVSLCHCCQLSTKAICCVLISLALASATRQTIRIELSKHNGERKEEKTR